MLQTTTLLHTGAHTYIHTYLYRERQTSNCLQVFLCRWLSSFSLPSSLHVYFFQFLPPDPQLWTLVSEFRKSTLPSNIYYSINFQKKKKESIIEEIKTNTNFKFTFDEKEQGKINKKKKKRFSTKNLFFSHFFLFACIFLTFYRLSPRY